MPTNQNKTVYIYTSLTVATYIQVMVTPAELPNLEAAIRAGSWYTNPASPNTHMNLAGVAQYVVA